MPSSSSGCGSFLGTSEEAYISDEQAGAGGSPTTLPVTPFTAPATTAPPPPTAGGQPAAAVSPASLASPQALEQRLAELRFDVSPDGVMDDNTRQAVIAFQKLNGLPRTGMATPDVTNALATARLPDPLKPDGGPTRVEIDLGRQVLFLYVNGTLNKVLPVSTGTGKRYCDEGKCGIATTPKGSFRIERRISGWRKSDLGRLYNPLYFNGGNRYSWLPFGATDPRLSWLRAHPHGFGRSLSKAGVRRYAGLRDVTTPRCSAGRIGRSPSGCCFR